MKLFALLGSLLAAQVLLHSVSAENEQALVSSIEKDLLYDTNRKLVSHHVFYPADNQNCPAANYDTLPYGYSFTPLTGEALQSVFPDYQEGSSCRAACAERGTDASLVPAILPHKQTRTTSDMADFTEWLGTNCLTVDVCLVNYYSRDYPILVYWVDTVEEQAHLQTELWYGSEQTSCFQSQIGHQFQIYDGQDDEILLDEFTIEHALFKAFGKDSADPGDFDFEPVIVETLHDEWERHTLVQRTFSPLGFQKGRLPDDVFASMGAFYYNNRNNHAKEEWTTDDGPYVNWWEADCFMIEIPRELKVIWQERLKELVQEWAGVEIEQTDMYGMRKYTQGARLLTHVDRVTTHAVSLIVNVAQGNVSKPWPVEINDHQNRLHQFTLEPGEILYYESAKCLHGRNQPLQGENSYYVNLFTHYRPTIDSVGDPDWYTKPIPEGGSGPPEETSNGECTTQELNNMAEGGQCSGQGSASAFQATSAEDLIRWWRLTGEEQAQ